jgi:hypothetical protein
VPKGTPKNITAKLNAAVMDALVARTARARLADLGQEIFPPDQQMPEALRTLQKAEIEKWWPIGGSARPSSLRSNDGPKLRGQGRGRNRTFRVRGRGRPATFLACVEVK